MLEIRYTTSFKKDYKQIKKRGYDLSKLKKVIELLAKEEPLPSRFNDHKLKGGKV